LRIARSVGVPIEELWQRFGAELPLWEASFELDPPAPERIDNAAWQIARAARFKGTIYDSDFDGTEKLRTADVPHQSDEQMLIEATKIESTWPHRVEVKREATKNTKRKKKN